MPTPGSHQTPRLLPAAAQIFSACSESLTLRSPVYLRNFALWCRNSFSDKAAARSQAYAKYSAAGTMMRLLGRHLQSFMLQVKSDGTVVTTPVASGSATRVLRDEFSYQAKSRERKFLMWSKSMDGQAYVRVNGEWAYSPQRNYARFPSPGV